MTSPAEFSDHRRDHATSRHRQSRSHSSGHHCDSSRPINPAAQTPLACSPDQPTSDKPSSVERSKLFHTERQQRLWNVAAQLRCVGACDQALARLREMLNDGGRDGSQELSPRARRLVQRAVAAILRDQRDYATAASFQQAAGLECNDAASTADPDRSAALVGFAADRWFAGDKTAAIALARSACVAAEEHGDRDDLAISHGHLGAMLAGVGRISEAIRALLRSWRFHSPTQHPVTTSPVLSRSQVLGKRLTPHTDTAGEALTLATMNPTDMNQPGDPAGQGWAAFHLAEIAILIGRYRAAQRLASRARRHFELGDCTAGIDAAIATLETARRCMAVREFDATRN